MERLLKFIGSVVLFFGTLAVSGQVFAESSNDGDTSSDDKKGQLVVSVETDPQKQSVQSTSDSMVESNKLEQSGFQVEDSLLDSIQSDSAQAMSNDFKLDVVDKMGLVYLIEYSEDEYQNIDQAKKKLKKSLQDAGLNVRYIQKNYTMHALEEESTKVSPADIHPDQQWNYDMIKAPEAWDVTPGSSSTKMAVLDTGIDSDHPNLSNFVDTSLGKSFVGEDTGDGLGHGTHVSGTIASYGDVSGVMQDATLIPVKVLDDDGAGSMYDIQQGITYAASQDADVVNMSLGGGEYDRGMEEAIETANDEGTVVVAASGNEGLGSVSYPAAYDSVIAVGSVTPDQSRSNFSNYGPELDVMAPGSDIYSTVPGGGYETMSGTSMASPHVAGVMGLIKSANPDLSVEEAKTILTDTAQSAGSELEYGYGIVDAYAAVQEATADAN